MGYRQTVTRLTVHSYDKASFMAATSRLFRPIYRSLVTVIGTANRFYVTHSTHLRGTFALSCRLWPPARFNSISLLQNKPARDNDNGDTFEDILKFCWLSDRRTNRRNGTWPDAKLRNPLELTMSTIDKMLAIRTAVKFQGDKHSVQHDGETTGQTGRQ